MIDNCCSKCITNFFADFIATPSKVEAQINGIGGPIFITHKKGTVRWKFEDDSGRIHAAFVVPGALYAPKAPCQKIIKVQLDHLCSFVHHSYFR